jgi:magnesium transporter
MQAHIDEMEDDLTKKAQVNTILELIQYNEAEYAKFENLKCDTTLKHFKEDHVNWINHDGLDATTVKKLGKHFDLHRLLVEDILTECQPKVEEFDHHLFVSMKMLYRIDPGKIIYEPINFVLGKNYLLTFQEKEGDSFGPFRERIRLGLGQVRKKKSDYLMYRLIDIIVDNYYAILENIGQQIETTEEEVYKHPTSREFQKIQNIKKELIFLRKALYPLRDAVSKLTKGESDFIDPVNNRYYMDVYDHIMQIINTLDTYRDLTTGLMDIHINSVNIRMTEVMKVLAIFSAIFMPLTFIVGIYGMNFNPDQGPLNMPELNWKYGYPAVLLFMVALTFGLIRYFKYKKWM